MGTVGDAFDNAVIESFWARPQTELLDRKKWKTRIELSTALFEYLEIFKPHPPLQRAPDAHTDRI
jgi:putative transposase